MIRKIAAHYVFPVVTPPVKFGILVMQGNGEIIEVIDNKGAMREIASLEFYDGILIPGFIATHNIREGLLKLKTMLSETPPLSLAEAVKKMTLDEATRLDCSHNFGSFEKNKYPGVNLISKIDFSTMRLTEHSQIRTLVIPGKLF